MYRTTKRTEKKRIQNALESGKNADDITEIAENDVMLTIIESDKNLPIMAKKQPIENIVKEESESTESDKMLTASEHNNGLSIEIRQRVSGSEISKPLDNGYKIV